jgi:hypothetical protein
MVRISTERAVDFIAALEPFTTNGALSAEFDELGAYVVKSYSTAVAVILPHARHAILNGARYSRTTSGHQHAARLGVARLGYQVTERTEPEAFLALTGHRARVRGANLQGRK